MKIISIANSTAYATRKHQQNGALSLELGLVLLVVALLVSAAVVYYRDNIRKSSISANIGSLTYIAANARVKYGKQNMYVQATTANVVRAQVIPVGLRDGAAATASNLFGAAITTAAATLTGANDAMTIVWGNIPTGQCSDIITGSMDEFRQISVGATIVKPLDGVLNLTTLETACDVAAPVAATFWVGRS